MRAVGIIAEYNPFHNGHKRHMDLSRERSGRDAVIVVMNGSFSQRGEPMALSKRTRTEAALLCGADIVIELPALFGVRPAEGFARGGVRLLAALGCVDTLSFGCETEDIGALTRAAEYLNREPEEYRALLKQGLSRGESFARARAEALTALLGESAGWIDQPNAALAIEYLRENLRLGSPMRPLAILRGAPHSACAAPYTAHTASHSAHAIPRTTDRATHSANAEPHNDSRAERGSLTESAGLASNAGLASAPEIGATAIREALSRGDIGSVSAYMPGESYELLKRAYPAQAPREEALNDLTLFAIRAMTADRLRSLPDMAEGLEGRFMALRGGARSRAELLSALKCKRYPYARLSRILAQALIGGDAALVRDYPAPPYARLLGFRKSAAPLLSRVREQSALPVIDRARALRENPVFALERRATDVRALLSRDPAERYADADYSGRLIVL